MACSILYSSSSAAGASPTHTGDVIAVTVSVTLAPEGTLAKTDYARQVDRQGIEPRPTG